MLTPHRDPPPPPGLFQLLQNQKRFQAFIFPCLNSEVNQLKATTRSSSSELVTAFCLGRHSKTETGEDSTAETTSTARSVQSPWHFLEAPIN